MYGNMRSTHYNTIQYTAQNNAPLMYTGECWSSQLYRNSRVVFRQKQNIKFAPEHLTQKTISCITDTNCGNASHTLRVYILYLEKKLVSFDAIQKISKDLETWSTLLQYKAVHGNV